MASRTSTSSTKDDRTCDGFTLIELIAVIAIVAILAATATPAIHSLSDTRRASAANLLLRDMTLARQHAAATGATTWVVFDLAAQKWSILVEDVDDPGRAGATPWFDPGTGRAHERALGQGALVGAAIVSVDFDGGTEVGFDWRGRPLNASEQPLAATGRVTLSGGHVVRVEVGTGHAER